MKSHLLVDGRGRGEEGISVGKLFEIFEIDGEALKEAMEKGETEVVCLEGFGQDGYLV